ncbi:MAG: LysM peptidoglycan-binding domain-containing protein, partial [bacterium]|nr:LysM peptidoglycan-binding domain-containing protein [bacterium]
MRVVGVIFILSCLLVLKAPLAYADDGTVEIKKGDTCWDLSYKLAGDGLRFRELYYENAQALDEKARNMGLDSSDFCRKIFPGTLLRVPASMTGEILPRSFLPQVHMPSPLEEPKQGFVFPEMW